jgi:hypothetical protein
LYIGRRGDILDEGCFEIDERIGMEKKNMTVHNFLSFLVFNARWGAEFFSRKVVEIEMKF